MGQRSISRSVFGVYTSDVQTPQGISLHRFTTTKDQLANVTINPDNVGFCTPNTSCMGSGVLNISQCQLCKYLVHVSVCTSGSLSKIYIQSASVSYLTIWFICLFVHPVHLISLLQLYWVVVLLQRECCNEITYSSPNPNPTFLS